MTDRADRTDRSAGRPSEDAGSRTDEPTRGQADVGADDLGEHVHEVTDEVADRAMSGDPSAQRRVDEAWDATEPMSGEAPTG